MPFKRVTDIAAVALALAGAVILLHRGGLWIWERGAPAALASGKAIVEEATCERRLESALRARNPAGDHSVQKCNPWENGQRMCFVKVLSPDGIYRTAPITIRDCNLAE